MSGTGIRRIDKLEMRGNAPGCLPISAGHVPCRFPSPAGTCQIAEKLFRIGGAVFTVILAGTVKRFVGHRSQVMVTELQGIPGVKAALIENVVGNQPFGVKLEIDEQITPLNYDQLVAKLKDSDPPIWTRVVDGFISLSVFGLNEGEEDIVGKRIAELLNP